MLRVYIGHVLIGDNEGLYLLDITGDNLFKFGDRDVRKVSQIRVMQEDNLVALLAGKGGKWLWLSNVTRRFLSFFSPSLLPSQVPSVRLSVSSQPLPSSMER